MTPEHAAVQLLHLEPLTHTQLRFYTGWDIDKTYRVTNSVIRSGAVTLHTDGHGARFWVTWRLRAWLIEQAARQERVRRLGRRPLLRSVG